MLEPSSYCGERGQSEKRKLIDGQRVAHLPPFEEQNSMPMKAHGETKLQTWNLSVGWAASRMSVDWGVWVSVIWLSSTMRVDPLVQQSWEEARQH